MIVWLVEVQVRLSRTWTLHASNEPHKSRHATYRYGGKTIFVGVSIDDIHREQEPQSSFEAASRKQSIWPNCVHFAASEDRFNLQKKKHLSESKPSYAASSQSEIASDISSIRDNMANIR